MLSVRNSCFRKCATIFVIAAVFIFSCGQALGAPVAQTLFQQTAKDQTDPDERGRPAFEFSQGTTRIQPLTAQQAAATSSLNCTVYCGQTVSYVSWKGNYNIMQEYDGLYVRLLIPRYWFDNPAFTEDVRHTFVDGWDLVYQYLYEIVGRRPSSGLDTIAAVNPPGCGASCGTVGGPGVEIGDQYDYFVGGSTDGLEGYGGMHEMTHNFDSYGGVYKFSGLPDSSHYWTTMLRSVYLYSADQNDVYDLQYENTLLGYLNLPANVGTWQNCVIASQSSCGNASGYNAPIGMFYRIAHLYGQASIARWIKFIHDTNANNPPTTDQGKLDNFFEAYSAAANRNVNCVFDELNWPISTAVRTWVDTNIGTVLTNPDCSNGPGGKSSILYGISAEFPPVQPPATPTANNVSDSNGTGFTGAGYWSPQHATYPATISSHGIAGQSQVFVFDGILNQNIILYACSPQQGGFSGGTEIWHPSWGTGGPSFTPGVCNITRMTPTEALKFEVSKGSGAFSLVAVPDNWVQPPSTQPSDWANLSVSRNESTGEFTMTLAQVDATKVSAKTAIFSGPQTVRFWAERYGWVKEIPWSAGSNTYSAKWTPPPGTSTESLEFRAQVYADAANGYASHQTTPFVYHTPSPALQVTQLPTSLPLTLGEPTTYAITITNVGGSASTAPIKLTDAFVKPGDATFVGASGSNWTCTGSALSCAYSGSLAAGASTTVFLSVNVAANASSSIEHDVFYSGGGDLTCVNSTPCKSVVTLPTAAAVSSISLSLSANPSPFLAGHAASYSIQLENKGGQTTTHPIVVSDTLPAGVTYVSASGSNWSCSGTQTLSCTYQGSLAYYEQAALTVNVTIAGNAASSLSNTATAKSADDPNCNNNNACVATATTAVSAVPALGLTAQASPSSFAAGQPGAYAFNVTNSSGTATSAAITLTDNLPAGVTYVSASGAGWTCTNSGSKLSCSLASLGANASTTLTANVSIASSAAGRLANAVSISGGGDPSCPASACSVTVSTPVVNSTVTAPVLSISASANPNTFTPGGSASYAFIVANSGNAATASGKSITLTSTLPAGATFSGASGTGWSCTLGNNNANLSCTLPSLAVNASSTVTANVVVASDAPSSITDTTQVSGGGDASCPAASQCNVTLTTQVGAQSSLYVALSPARLLDTRIGPSFKTIDGTAQGTGPIASVGTYRLPVTGRAGIPAGVVAVALNVTPVNPTSTGYFTLWSGVGAAPNASNLNLNPGYTIPNLVISPVDGNGNVAIFNGSSAAQDVVVDVQGYFPAGSAYVPMTPQRYLDTRSGQQTIDGQYQGGGALAKSGRLDLSIAGRGPSIPASGVGAVIYNLTAVLPNGPGFITAWPSGVAQPNASNLNLNTGLTIPNLVISGLGSGNVSLFNGSGNATDLIADVQGWFPSNSGYAALAPARLLDTRGGQQTIDGQYAGGGALTTDGKLDLQVTGRGGVPAGSQAGTVVLNITAVLPATAGYVTVWPTGSPQPLASNLNLNPGTTIPNLVIAKVGSNGKVSIYNGSTTSTDILVDVQGWLPSGQ